MATDTDAILVAWSWSQPGTHILLVFYAHLLYFLFMFSYSLPGCSVILRKRISRKSRWRGKRSDFNLGLTVCRTLCPVCPGHSIIGSFSGSVDNCWRVHFRDDKPELRKLSHTGRRWGVSVPTRIPPAVLKSISPVLSPHTTLALLWGLNSCDISGVAATGSSWLPGPLQWVKIALSIPLDQVVEWLWLQQLKFRLPSPRCLGPIQSPLSQQMTQLLTSRAILINSYDWWWYWKK